MNLLFFLIIKIIFLYNIKTYFLKIFQKNLIFSSFKAKKYLHRLKNRVYYTNTKKCIFFRFFARIITKSTKKFQKMHR